MHLHSALFIPSCPPNFCFANISKWRWGALFHITLCFFVDQLLPTALQGGKVVIQKGLSNFLQTSHTLTLGTSKSQPSSWAFGATYIGTYRIGENDVRCS